MPERNASRDATRPSLHGHFAPLRNERAQGRPDARCTRGLVCKGKRSAHTSIQVQRRHPAFPAQWFDGLCRALPGDEFLLPPSLPDWRRGRTRLDSNRLRKLDTSHGCQDHTLLPYATTPLVLRGSIAHSSRQSLGRPAMPRARNAIASTASRTPRIVTTRTPLFMRRDGVSMEPICG